MEIQKIRIKSDYKLADIVHDIERGILRIPQFQREFVWDKQKVIKLLESIYLEYPIGSFFFWDAPEEYHNFYRDIAELNLPKPEKYDKVIFILDGQQRLTSLYTAVKGLQLYGRNYGDICFDLDEHTFLDRKPDNERYISFRDLLADDKPDVYDNLTTERKASFKDCYRRFVNYPFSAIDVRDKDLDEVCDIFERINQGGQRLNLFDLIAAGTWSKDFDLRVAVKAENEQYKRKGYGEIDNEVFIQTLALIAKGSCTRVIQLQLREADVKSYWQETLESLRQAVDWTKHELGAVTTHFLPYRSMLAEIAYLFHKVDRRALSNNQVEAVSMWYWQTAFSERYGASILTIMTEDRKLMDKIAEEKEASVRYPFAIDIDSLIKVRMYRKSAIKNAVLCLLARRHPRHFKNNTPLALDDSYYSDFNNIEKHHIFPKSIVQKQYSLVMVHSLPNFCFIPAELNKEISNKKPSEYFEDIQSINPDFHDTLKTHLIRYDEAVKRDDYMSFLASRAAMLLEEITKVTGSKVSAVIVDNVNKAIDQTEVMLRDLIDRELTEKEANYWKSLIPSDVSDLTTRRIEQMVSNDPSKSVADYTSRQRLDYLDVMDYPKIILSNWDVFWKYFRSKYEVEKRFISFKEYRNVVKHNREEIPSFLKKEGEAALEWLALILKEATQPTESKSIPALTDEDIIKQSETEFVERAVKQIPAWIESDFPKDEVRIVRWKDTRRSLYIGKSLSLFYYYAARWVFCKLQSATAEEIQILKSNLSEPSSVAEQNDRYNQVGFRVLNDQDFEVVKQVIKKRYSNTKKA